MLFLLAFMFGLSNSLLPVGANAPDFTLQDHAGNSWNLQDHLKHGPVVMFFYPKDKSPGCTAEACRFRDEYQDFVDAKAQVVGVNSAAANSHKGFVEKNHLPYPLLVDEGKHVMKLYGVPESLLANRVTFVISQDDKVAFVFSSAINMSAHSKQALEAVKKMAH